MNRIRGIGNLCNCQHRGQQLITNSHFANASTVERILLIGLC
jgi:hypothetical protein